MKTFLSVKIAGLPFALFWLAAGAGHPLAGAVLGAALAAAGLAYRVRRNGPRTVEGAALVILGALALALAIPLPGAAAHAAAWSLLALGAAAFASVLARRPWTGAFAAAAWPGAAASAMFYRINQFVSALWAALFLYLGLARMLAFGPLALWLPVALGAAVSILPPPRLVRLALARQLAARQPYRWPAPDFRQAAGNDADVVVVGAGLGGLTAAALLAQAGLRVIVCEQHSAAGGFAHTWLRKGRDGAARPVFRFDSGVHDVSGCWDGAPVHGILRRLGLLDRLDWRRLDHRYLAARGVFDVPRRWQDYVEELAAAFPPAAEGIRAALADLRAIHAAMYADAGRHCGVPGAPQTVDGMLQFARRHPLAVRWLDQPFERFLRHHIADPRARELLKALSGYVTEGEPTVYQMAPLFGYYLHGGFYPAGGSGRLAGALAESVEARGGSVRLKTPVAQVLLENGRACGVRLGDGGNLRAAAVVLNGDLLEAAGRLIDPQAWPAPFRALLAAGRPACSAFAVHLGVRGEFPGARPVIHVAAAGGGLGIVIPSMVDPGAAPAGYSCVELLRLLPADEAARWLGNPDGMDDQPMRDAAEYRARKRALGDEMIALAEQALPGLSARIVLRCEASPATFRRYAWTRNGSIYGTILEPGRIGSKSPLPGLVFAGAATHGAGVEAVMISGARAAEALLPGLLEAAAGARPALSAAAALAA